MSDQVVLLGTGTPNADPARSGPCVAIVVDGCPYLIDFGPGVVRRAAAAHEAGVEGLAANHNGAKPDLAQLLQVSVDARPCELAHHQSLVEAA